LGRIGFDHVTGYMQGGMEALAGRADLVWPTTRASAPAVAEELASASPPLLLDVRTPREWAAKHVEGSMNVPLNHLHERIAEIPRERGIAVHCAGGYRSSIAASILQQYGITNLTEMAGGLAAWEAARLPVVSAV
jgi:hydroxyacylglutathione hydrolase